jgi:pilus assembly protein Flp/PilA
MNHRNLKFKKLNQKGQTLIEYLIIVAILGVGSIFVMGVVGQQVNSRFARVVKSLGGTVENEAMAPSQLTRSQTSRKTLANFAKGARENSNQNGNGSSSGNGNDSEE